MDQLKELKLKRRHKGLVYDKFELCDFGSKHEVSLMMSQHCDFKFNQNFVGATVIISAPVQLNHKPLPQMAPWFFKPPEGLCIQRITDRINLSGDQGANVRQSYRVEAIIIGFCQWAWSAIMRGG